MISTIVIAKAIVRGPNGKILLLRRAAHDVNRPSQLDFPGGGVEDNEDFGAAVSREIFEETGLQIIPAACELIYSFTAMKGADNIIRLFYLASTNQEVITLQAEEHSDFYWLNIDEAIAQHEYPRHRQVLEYIKQNDLLS